MNRQLAGFTGKAFIEQQFVRQHGKPINIGPSVPARPLHELRRGVWPPHRKTYTHALEDPADSKTCDTGVGVGHEHVPGMQEAVLGTLPRAKVDGLCNPPDNPRHITRGGRAWSLGDDIQ